MIGTESLDPCPECGSGHIELTGNPFISGKRWVACCQCRHTGPLGDTEWEAIAGWNRERALTPA